MRETVFPALLLLCVLTTGVADVSAALTPQENWNVVLTPVVTEFRGHTGLDHHQPSRKLILSAHTTAGEPHSFELLAGDGGHSAFSNVAGLQGNVLVATARDDGQGVSRGGFQPGTLFATTGASGVVARISADGASVQNPWVVLPDEGEITGLHLDRTGVFGGDLVVVTAAGGVWRVSASATPTRLAAFDTRLAGVAVVPDDVLAYGPWAGKVLAGAKELGSVYAIDAQGQSVSFAVGLNPQDIDIVPAHENFYAIDHTSRKLLGAAEGALTGIIGDIIVTQESPGLVSRVRWDGTGFVVTGLAEAPGLKQVAFSPAGAGVIPAVKQVYGKIAVVRHAPLLDSGRIEGTLWQLTGETTSFDGTDTITSDLLVPGIPQVTAAASASYGGTIEGTESAEPTGYRVTIAGSASLRHVVTRTAPIVLQEVAFPPAPQGTRDVQLRKAGESVGDAATLRHLDVGGNAGSVPVPPGTYGRFTVSGRNTLVLGVAGSIEPAVYNLEELALTGGSSLHLAGPVTLRVRKAVTLVGSTVGAADDPKRLRLEVAHGRPADAVKVGGTGVLYGIVRAPRGTITIYGSGRLRGTVACDVLHVDGNGVLQITENDIPPPPVNRPPTANAGPDHTITLPIDTVALDGTASDDGLPTGSTLAITWTVVSGPGPVTFAEASQAATSATFPVAGDYVLKLTASDGQLISSDTVSVTVVPRNQPPVVDAGEQQIIELPASAELRGTVTDDALPRGAVLTVTWSATGPGDVTFADAHAAATTASFSVPGVYTLRLSANDTEFTVSDDVTVTVLKNVAPTVDAGLDGTITLPVDTLALEGTATDDGLPSGSTLAVSWTKVSGPGAVAFGEASSAATSVTFTVDGEYVLQLTASDGALSASDTVTITVIPRNEPPVVEAGQAQTIELPSVAELRATVTDDGLPRGSTLTVTWIASGPGPVTFANPNAPVTTASFTAPGVYTLRLSANDTELTVSDEVVITVLKNDPPVVNAGPDKQVVLPNTVKLTGTASDDGMPSGSTLEVFWTQISGPVPVIFHDAFAVTTSVTFALPGTYVLRLTASDSQLSATDEVTIVVSPQPFTSRTYTLDADFNEGSLVNIARNIPHQLQLDGTSQTLNFIWVAASSKGTVVKINTETGAVLGEYFTSPAGQPRDPSRTTVDNNGNVWAGNRAGNSVIHIGLVENGQCVDRNNNGLIETSTGYGDIKPWPNTNNANTNGGVTLAQDECILHYTKVNSSVIRHVSVTKDNDVWVSGTTGRRFDLIDGKTGAIKRAEPSVGYGGYGGLTDKNGVIWSANPLLRWDTAKPLTGPSGGNWTGYSHNSYGLCIDSQGNVWNVANGTNRVYKFAPDGTLLGSFTHGTNAAQGCVVDKNDHVWIAQSYLNSTVAHLKNDGSFVGRVVVGKPTGVAVDAKGKIWATNYDLGTVARIDPNAGPLGPDGVTRVGAVDFTTQNLGGTLYNYSDMTGSTLLGAPDAGTWSTVFDTKLSGAAWGSIGWTAQVCGDAQLTVSVASSENGTTFGAAVPATNGSSLTVANGRYLKVTVNFKRASSGESPVLYDLSVGTNGYALPAAINSAPTALAGADLSMTLPDAFKLGGSACDDGFPRGNTLAVSWTKVSGPGTAIFTNPGSTTPNVTFTLPGDYVLRLTVSDGEYSASDEVSVTALPANAAPVVNAGPNQTVTLPNSGTLNGTVSDDGLPTGATVSTFWSQVSGPGTVTFNYPGSPVTTAIFPVTGTYTLRLAGYDSHRSATDDVVITVNPSPALTGATLALVAGNAGPYVTGTAQPLHATLKSSTGTPLANYGVEFTVAGANPTGGSAVTNASGVATFIHSGTNLGTDTVTALVRHTSTANINSPAVAMTWAQAAVPAVQGWIGAPVNGSTATGIVPITAAVTLNQGSIEYWPATNPSAVTVLATNAQGGPGATLATLDTTLLANGSYVIRLTATDANGQSLVSQVVLTVAGENKPGRVTLSYTDLTVPAAGIPITIKRRYDSLERNQVGDFGHGWSLEMAGPRLEVSPTHAVTITEPGTGRRVTFQFTPKAFGFPFSFLYQPGYTAEQGVYGKLASDGCGTLIRTSSGVACYLSSDPTYRPNVYSYTDPYGRVYTMTATGKMQSIQDLNGNVLTFSANGITSSAGNLNVPFMRDAQGRITRITDPAGKSFVYSYDAAGDLSTVELPGVSTPFSYTYEPGHYFSSSTDPRGNTQASSTYHPDGRLASFTDAVGNTTTHTYDLAANRNIVTYPDGGVATSTYSANGLLLSETNPLGHTTTYTYDANRNKLTETNALGQTTTHTYDSRGNRTSTTDPAGRVQRWTYNQYGAVVTFTDPLNRVQTTKFDASFNPVGLEDSLGTRVTYTMDGRGNLLTETDGNGKTKRFTYDVYGHLLTRTDALGRTTTFTYDDMGRVLTMTDPRGGVTRSTYDALGNVLTVTDPLGGVTKYEYDGNGNKTAQVDAAGRRTTYDYDAADRLTKVTNPDSTTLTFTYDFRGQRLTETDQDGHTTSYAYDEAGRRVKVVNPDGTETTYEYDALGRVISQTNELNQTTRYEYDPNCGCSERMTKAIDAMGGVTTHGFDALGHVISQTDANQRETRFAYDARDLLTQTTYADGTTTKQTYDGAGRKLTEVDQAGKVTRFAYDEVGNVVSVTDALNQTTVHTYDALGNRLSTTDALGRTTGWEYDALNRVIRRVLPLGMAELYTYDQVGNRVSRTDFRGKQTTYEYDSMNRLLRKTPDATLGEPSVVVTYDRAGLRASMTDASGTTSYTYDARHRPLTKQTPQGTLTYTYDAAGHVATARSSNTNGFAVTYGYDAAERLESVVDHAGGTTTYSHDAMGNTLGVTLPNGVQTAWTYDSVDRPTQVTHSRGATLASYTQTLGPTGRRLTVTEGNGRNVGYSYDALYRLTGETVAGDPTAAANGSVAYTYDAVANRLSRTSTLAAVPSSISAYDANDRLTTEAYDANGNTRAANGSTYTYDFEDRITSVNGGAIRIVYDGDGNRVAKTAGGVTTRYLVDDLSPTGYSQVVEELAGGSVQRVYTYGARPISQRLQRNGNWQVSFFGADAYGSVRFLTDAAGAVTDTYAYDAFGILTSSTGTTPNNYLFNGQEYDWNLAVYFKRARYYSQVRGRFMTMDPVAGRSREPLTLHRYLFAHADPVNLIDPWGTTAIEYSMTTSRMAAAQATAMRCLSNIGVSLLTEAATEFLVIYAIGQVGGADPYVGRTGQRVSSPPDVDDWSEVRFREHRRSSRFAGGLEPISEFNVRIPKGWAPDKKRKLIQLIEQLAINAVGGEGSDVKLEMLNKTSAMNETDFKKYRKIFCGGK
ncbi:MAG TPA: RHS repeat-associated core domain-containing protein [Thermoanaerobaculia bacterium]